MKKQVVIFGLGIFGTTLAENLYESDCDVLAVDANIERVERVESFVTHAVVADVTDFEAIQSLNIESFDVAVVAIGTSLEASILAVMHLKELGIPYVVVKTRNKTNRIILEKIGADRVIIPEKEVSQRLSKRILSNKVIDVIQFSDAYTIVEMPTPLKWQGLSIQDLNKQFGIKVIALSHEKDLIIDLDSQLILKENDVLIVIASNKAYQHIEALT